VFFLLLLLNYKKAEGLFMVLLFLALSTVVKSLGCQVAERNRLT